MTDATDATARSEHAIALMREALALLESRGNEEAAAHLRAAIDAAQSPPRQANGGAHDR